jgi:hypothetical protein
MKESKTFKKKGFDLSYDHIIIFRGLFLYSINDIYYLKK